MVLPTPRAKKLAKIMEKQNNDRYRVIFRTNGFITLDKESMAELAKMVIKRANDFVDEISAQNGYLLVNYTSQEDFDVIIEGVSDELKSRFNSYFGQ